MKLLSLAVLLVGCAPGVTSSASEPQPNVKPDRYTKLNESPRPMKARAVETVTIYRTKAPDAPYVEVSEIGDSGGDEAEALDQLKLSAAGVGCDGLIIGAARNARSGPAILGSGNRVTEVAVSGTCIMFTQDPGTWRPSPMDVRCAEGRDKLNATKDADEKLAIARAMPPDCHR